MKKINSNLESYLNKIVSNTNQNCFSLFTKNSNKNINNLSIGKIRGKPSLNTFQQLSLGKTESTFNFQFGTMNRDNFVFGKSKSFLGIRTISKRFASKESNKKNVNRDDKISKNNSKTNDNSNTLIKTKSNKDKKATEHDEINEKDNRSVNSKKDLLSEPNKYNPEVIDKQSNLFNLTDKLPEKLQHYIKLGRYDRPIGYMLLFLPCTWGLTLATPFLDYNYLYHIFLFFTGSVLMRSGGCIINDMWDRDIDKMVERSKTRPLAAGYLTMKEASVFLALHLALSLVILLKLPLSSVMTGLGIMPIVIIYPFMKRVTYLPQLFLGLAFNSGVLVGYQAFGGLIDWKIIFPIYLGGVIWTVVYDTLYAHMDKLDDAKINVKSTALLFGRKTKSILILLTIAMMCLFCIGLDLYERKFIRPYRNIKFIEEEKKVKKDPNDKEIKVNNKVYSSSFHSEFDIKELGYSVFDLSYLGLLAVQIYQARLIRGTNLHDPLSCLKAFKKSSIYGIIILLCCLIKVKQRENVESKFKKRIAQENK